MFTKYICLYTFLISFSIGLFFIYILGPEVKTIYVYPTLNNYLKYQYKDNSNQCFEFKPLEVKCPLNPLSIKTIPLQN
jgi:hypothetical protein